MTRVLSAVQANHCPAELIERRDVSTNLAILRFRVAERLSFTAGQYATIGIAIDGDVVERPYSIVSSPHEPFFEFFIELVPGGDITPKLWELKLGSNLLLRRRIVGQFTLDTDFTHHLMLATVTGVAPFVSILRTQQIERERGAISNHQFVVIHGASQSADLGPYCSELEELSHAGWLTYMPTVSRPGQNQVGRAKPVESRTLCASMPTGLVLIILTRLRMRVVTRRWLRMSKRYWRAFDFVKTKSKKRSSLALTPSINDWLFAQ